MNRLQHKLTSLLCLSLALSTSVPVTGLLASRDARADAVSIFSPEVLERSIFDFYCKFPGNQVETCPAAPPVPLPPLPVPPS